MNKATQAKLEAAAGMTAMQLADISWNELNDALREVDTDTSKALLELELAGAKRLRYAQRIYSRYSTLRRHDENLHIKATCPYRKRGERA